MTSRLVLIGFRGTGKSTLATALASRLTLACLSTDKEIEKRVGKTIAEFVAANGWDEFRRIESEIIHALPTGGVVIDCGGGVVENPENMRLLRENSLIVWVDADVADIITRLTTADNAHRPLLSGASMEDDIRTNYARRKPIYEQWCGLYVNTSRQKVEDIVEEVSTLAFA
jgi:shikimate kinase